MGAVVVAGTEVEVASPEVVAGSGYAVLRWLYVNERARTVHAVPPFRGVAVCGLGPAWWQPGGWLGSGSQAQQQRARELPRCSRCVRVLGARAAKAARAVVAGWRPAPPLDVDEGGRAVRPVLDPLFAEVYDWLKANGVDEWLPEDPQLFVGGGRLTYTAWRWAGERGWDVGNIRVPVDEGDPVTETRTVVLRSGVTPRLRRLADVLSLQLFEGDAG